VRLSAAFPFVSPEARPESLPAQDGFVDGGFFDSSGIYSLMGWLEEAAEGVKDSRIHEIVLLQIDPFPEPNQPVDRRTTQPWYSQLLDPMKTIVGVRETGQAARIRYEFPLFAASLEPGIAIRRLEFRYRPSPRCALDSPPFSWHLTEFDKGCLAEAWEDSRIVKHRELLHMWLEER